MTSTELLKNIPLKISYRTGEDDPIRDFYIPCIKVSKNFFRAVGYFRSSIFMITGTDVINFAKQGGKIYLICSPELTKEDIDVINNEKATAEQHILEFIQSDLNNMLNEYKENYSIVVLATLIKVNALEIKIAIPEKGTGIFHSKIGIFEDAEKNLVSFIGSANESWSAWHEIGNREHIEVFSSWTDDRDRVIKHKSDFEKMWCSEFSGIRTIKFPDAMKEKIIRIAEENIESVDISKLKKINSEKSKKRIENLREHQEIALENWKLNNSIGLFQHATGSGKTVTALKAIDTHLKEGGVALVLVPSTLLHSQWASELNAELDVAKLSLLKVGSGNTAWKNDGRLEKFLSNSYKGDLQRVVLSTMQTACQDDFVNAFSKLDNLLIVIDEAHQVGSNNNSNVLRINAKKRLGLSATPVRYGDIEGTKRIMQYFEKIIDPIVTLYDAIKSGALVSYEYFPHILNLTAEEADNWKEISKQIRKEMAISNQGNDGIIKLSQRAKNLLINRSRIAKKSKTKLNLVEDIMKKYYSPGERWLVYCADKDQLNLVVSVLNNLKITSYEYYSDMTSDNSEVLKLFQLKGGVLVSIKCLDEGIDIPSISHALILASSQNPREFIQRRGRVLRTHKSKEIARIHDAIISPVSLEEEPDQFSLLKSELIRSYEFAQSAINKMAGQELQILATKLGINLNETFDDGFEEE
jgi:superfamily II DNA or RNA helicase